MKHQPIDPKILVRLVLKTGAAIAVFTVIGTSGLTAGEPITTEAALGKAVTMPADDPDSLFDRIWGLATLYEDDSNPVLQKLAFTGRFQFEYDHTDTSAGKHDEWIIRRWRMGFKAKVFEDFTLHSEAGFNTQTDDFYLRLTDTYIAWEPNKQLKFKVGKQSAPFTLDGANSSKELITIDRNTLSANLWFPQEYMPGVTVALKNGNWRHFLGVYSSGSFSKEFGNFDASGYLLARLGYDFADDWGAEEAIVSLDYVYQDPNEKNEFTRDLEHVGSLNFRYDNGAWGARTDLAAGKGYLGQSDLWGLVAMPFYNISKELQLVLRYTYIKSDDPNGIRTSRYFSRALSGRGDQYNEIYGGLNWYLYGHKLKWQTGIAYADMNDRSNDGGGFNGWGVTSGIRISW